MQKQEHQDPDMVKLARERLDFCNYKASKEIEVLAAELVLLGASSYAAGLRMVAFTALGLLADLKQPELASDLERIKAYCAEIDYPKTAA